jgi:hypothetical protein
VSCQAVVCGCCRGVLGLGGVRRRLLPGRDGVRGMSCGMGVVGGGFLSGERSFNSGRCRSELPGLQ